MHSFWNTAKALGNVQTALTGKVRNRVIEALPLDHSQKDDRKTSSKDMKSIFWG